MNEKIRESVKEAVEQIKRRGLNGDVYGIAQRNLSYSIQKGEVSDSSEYEDFGLGIRVLKNDRLGFGYCVPGREEEGVRKAVELSKLSEKIGLNLPDEEDPPSVKKFDIDIVKSSSKGKGAEFTQQMIDGVSSIADDITATRGTLSVVISNRVIGNTNGIFLEEKGSALGGGVMANIPGERTSLTAGHVDFSRKLDLDFKEIGEKAGEKVDSLREQSELKPGKMPVIISPDAMAQLLWFSLFPSFNGENVRKGKSVYEGKIGEKVADQDVNIIDDPTKDWGIGSGAFDDEGTISTELSIISDGEMRSFMYDLKEAEKSRKESTGHGIRTDFKNPPQISDRNIIVEGADNKLEELMPDNGIYIDGVMGAHTSNPVSGDFSVVANPVWLVENGEKQGRLDGIMISGNMPEVLNRVGFTDDHKNTFLSIGSYSIKMNIPSVRIDQMQVSGK